MIETDPMPTQQGYLPRNVINSPAVKHAIRQRSQQRTDPAEISQWLENHFFRWAIGNFANVSKISSTDDYVLHFGPDSPIPDWLSQRLLSIDSAPDLNVRGDFYYLDPDHLLLLQQELALVEFLNSRLHSHLAGKLQRITCPQAIAMWQADHKKMQAKREKGWFPSSGQGLKEILRLDNGAIFEFCADHPLLREEMAYESWHMQHCVGQFSSRHDLCGGYGEFYAEQIEAGQLRLFTLRSQGNMPHVTIALKVLGEHLQIDQIKGKQNRHPIRKYAEDTLCLLQMLSPQPERHPDCEGMGIVYEQNEQQPENQGWKFITNVQQQDFLLSVMNGNFHLIEHFEQPPAALQWLLLRSAPKELYRLQVMEPAVAAAARLMLERADWPQILQSTTANMMATNTTAGSIEGIPIAAELVAPLASVLLTKESAR